MRQENIAAPWQERLGVAHSDGIAGGQYDGRNGGYRRHCFGHRISGYRIRDSEYRSGPRMNWVDGTFKGASAWIPSGGIPRFRPCGSFGCSSGGVPHAVVSRPAAFAASAAESPSGTAKSGLSASFRRTLFPGNPSCRGAEVAKALTWLVWQQILPRPHRQRYERILSHLRILCLCMRCGDPCLGISNFQRRRFHRL